MNGHYNSGDIVLGNWTLTRLIGEGSYGRVFEAEREDFGRIYKAAIKIITIPQNQSEIKSVMADGMANDSVTSYFRGFVEELVDEITLMSNLKGNSNVVSYEDHTVVQHTDAIGWDIIIRMELLTPLIDYTQKNNLTGEGIIQLGIDMCKALELCQRFNIIHRDIKPENIFVSEMGDFKLGDFGIARTVEKTTGVMSKKGTYTYMAPEIYRGDMYGSNIDIYSLGIVMYRMLNENRAPFMPEYPVPIKYSDRENALAKRISGAKIPEPKYGGGRLTEIVLKACAYDPNDRYVSPKQMWDDLASIQYNIGEAPIIYPQEDGTPIKPIEHADGYVPRHETPINEGTQVLFAEPRRTSEGTESNPARNVFPATVQQNPYANEERPNQNGNDTNKVVIALISGVAGLFLIGLIVAAVFILNNIRSAVPAVLPSSLPSATVARQPAPEASPESRPESTSGVSSEPVPRSVDAPIELFDMSDDVYDFTVIVEGDVLKLPMTLEVFQSYGWVQMSQLKNTLIPSEYISVTFSKGGKMVDVQVVNMSDEVRKISKCTVTNMSITSTDRNSASMELPKGIIAGVSSKEEVVAAFGEPIEVSDSDYTYVTEYYQEGNKYRTIELKFDKQNDSIDSNILNTITIENLVRLESDEVEIGDEITEREKAYKAPTELGDDFTSFIVKLEGDLYQLPAPMSAFLDNGFEIVDPPTSMSMFRSGIVYEYLPGKTGTQPRGMFVSLQDRQVYIQKGNITYSVHAYNYEDGPLVIERCFVTAITSPSDDAQSDIADFELSGGIALNKSHTLILEKSSDLLRYILYSGSQTFGYYEYDNDRQGHFVQIKYDEKSSLINEIEIRISE